MVKRRDAMTERQRIEALLSREKPDRAPMHSLCLGFLIKHAGGAIADAYSKPAKFLSAQRKTCRDFGFLFIPACSYLAMGAWEFGGEIKLPTREFDQAPMITRYPVETPDDVMSLKMPDIRNAGYVPTMIEFNKLSSQEVLDNEPWNVSNISTGVFTLAANIPGAENFARWLIKAPEAAHRLLRLATDYAVDLAKYWKDTFGTEGTLCKDNEPTTANQMISPKQFEEFALPYIKEYHEKLLDMGYKTLLTHVCGEQNANLSYWAQIPFGDPGIVSVGHEVDLEKAAKYFPNDIILGNLEPTIIQMGTPEDVYEASRKIIETGKRLNQGFIFAPGCELPPLSSSKNVMAMTTAVNDFGWYD